MKYFVEYDPEEKADSGEPLNEFGENSGFGRCNRFPPGVWLIPGVLFGAITYYFFFRIFL